MEALRLDEGSPSKPSSSRPCASGWPVSPSSTTPGFPRPSDLIETGRRPGRWLWSPRRPSALRLSQVLASAADQRERFNEAAITDLAVTLAGALVAIQRLSKEMSVGTLAAERVLVTADSRILVTEHVFATRSKG